MNCTIFRALCAAAIAAGMLSGCNRPGAQAMPAAAMTRPPAPVVVEAATSRDVPIYIDETYPEPIIRNAAEYLAERNAHDGE